MAWRLWTRMGWQEIRRRYRRTIIGPLWVTLSVGMFVGGMGFVWAPLFRVSTRDYIPFVTAGVISWTFVASIITESCTTYISSEGLIKTLKIPLSLLNWMLVCRNTITLFHNMLVAVAVYLIFLIHPKIEILLFFPGLVLAAINGVWMGMLLGMISARYRDIPQLVGNLIQIMMFVTPVFWQISQLGSRARIIKFNLLYHIIDVIRAPMLGEIPSALSYEVDIALAVFGWTLAFWVFARFRRRIAYWL